MARGIRLVVFMALCAVGIYAVHRSAVAVAIWVGALVGYMIVGGQVDRARARHARAHGWRK